MTKQTPVKLPEGLINKIDKYMEKNKEYTTRTEFIKEAIREHLRRIR